MKKYADREKAIREKMIRISKHTGLEVVDKSSKWMHFDSSTSLENIQLTTGTGWIVGEISIYIGENDTVPSVGSLHSFELHDLNQIGKDEK